MISGAHYVLAWLVVIANGCAGLLCLSAHRWPRLRSRWLWIFVAAAQLTLFLQAALGAIRQSQLGEIASQVHTFYGFLTIVCIAILYGYRSHVSSHIYVFYGLGSLFIMGLAIRAMTLEVAPLANSMEATSWG